MIGGAFLSALRNRNSKVDHGTEKHLQVSIEDLVNATYRGLLDREPDPVGEKTYRQFLDDGVQKGTLKIAEMLRACITSSEFLALHLTEVPEPRETIGIGKTDAEQVFSEFPKYQGSGRPGYVTNFLGCLNNVDVTYGIKTLEGAVEDYPFLGNFHGSTMEWVGALRAVLEADDAFRMLELGAGWGPWCVVGYRAAVQRGISEIQVIGVEGDAGHVKFMEDNFAVNELRPDAYSIIGGVVGVADGEALFPKAKEPSEVYGGAPAFATNGDADNPFNFFMRHCSEIVDHVEPVPAFSLATLMAELPIVDLIHCDIQGGELDLFTNAIDLVSQKVKRVVIGTHSWQIDRGLMGLFATRGWVLEGAEDCLYRRGMLFGDGTQVWRNPRLTG